MMIHPLTPAETLDSRKHEGPFYQGGYPQAGKQSGTHMNTNVPPW